MGQPARMAPEYWRVPALFRLIPGSAQEWTINGEKLPMTEPKKDVPEPGKTGAGTSDPAGAPQPVPGRTPTVEELHARLPDDAPGAGSKEHREARLKREEEAHLHPPAYPGMHRETPRGELIA